MDFEWLIAALNDYVIVASVIAIRNVINCAALGTNMLNRNMMYKYYCGSCTYHLITYLYSRYDTYSTLQRPQWLLFSWPDANLHALQW